MSNDIVRWSQGYQTALRKHLGHRAMPNLRSMSRMGHRATSIGVGVRDVTRIHKESLANLKSINTSGKIRQRAKDFITAAIVSIEKALFARRKSPDRLGKLNKLLGRRQTGLDTTNRSMLADIVRRKSTEANLNTTGELFSKRLNESAQLQLQLRQLMHRMMATQEDDRKNISQELQNDIAQTLLGINVRLLSLKKTARSGTREFKKEISSTQQLILKSAKSVRKFARQLNASQQRPNKERDELRRESAKHTATSAMVRRIHKKNAKQAASHAHKRAKAVSPGCSVDNKYVIIQRRK